MYSPKLTCVCVPQIHISSKTRKHDPTYYLTVRYTAPASPSSWTELKTQAPFARWFTADGYFVAKPFQQWLASEVPLVGEADPNNVVEEIGRGNASSSSATATGSIPVFSQGGAKARRKA